MITFHRPSSAVIPARKSVATPPPAPHVAKRMRANSSVAWWNGASPDTTTTIAMHGNQIDPLGGRTLPPADHRRSRRRFPISARSFSARWPAKMSRPTMMRLELDPRSAAMRHSRRRTTAPGRSACRWNEAQALAGVLLAITACTVRPERELGAHLQRGRQRCSAETSRRPQPGRARPGFATRTRATPLGGTFRSGRGPSSAAGVKPDRCSPNRRRQATVHRFAVVTPICEPA